MKDKCGDGRNLGGVGVCDDGNTVDGDGCSSLCQVEDGFHCSGGTYDTPDVCVDIVAPSAFLSTITTENTIYIEFTEDVQIQPESMIYQFYLW